MKWFISPGRSPNTDSRSLLDTGCSQARRNLCSTWVSEKQNTCCLLKPQAECQFLKGNNILISIIVINSISSPLWARLLQVMVWLVLGHLLTTRVPRADPGAKPALALREQDTKPCAPGAQPLCSQEETINGKKETYTCWEDKML